MVNWLFNHHHPQPGYCSLHQFGYLVPVTPCFECRKVNRQIHFPIEVIEVGMSLAMLDYLMLRRQWPV